MNRLYNFSAGPSMLPAEVLLEAQEDLVSYKGCGSSVMEMSHRSKYYEPIIKEAEQTLRDIMHITDDYYVLFLQGGASLQFSMLPMNLANKGDVTAYAITGNFAKKAWEEAKRWTKAEVVTNGAENGFKNIPEIKPELIPEGAKYLHITGNNTIFGTAYNTLPNAGNTPLVADWSSGILGRNINVNDYAAIYAGAQKNMGIAGLTVVIIKKDIVNGDLAPEIPTMLRYDVMAKNDSMYNTPPAFAIYMAGLVFKWVKAQGGVEAMEKKNAEKATLLYDYLDASKMFTPVAAKKDRSDMNVTFTLPDEELTKAFLKMAEGREMINIKGHRSVGGCRASIYNAMPVEGVKTLVQCMNDFEKGIRE